METAISKYCEECLKFTQKKCKGRHPTQSFNLHWGIKKPQNRSSGLHFCKEYEFDIRLYKFQDGSGINATAFKRIRERQVKRDIENEQQEAFDDFDLGASLNLDDFVDFIEEE